MKTFEQPLSAKEETEYLEEMNGEDLEAAHTIRPIWNDDQSHFLDLPAPD